MDRPPFMNSSNPHGSEVNWAQLAQRWIAERSYADHQQQHASSQQQYPPMPPGPSPSASSPGNYTYKGAAGTAPPPQQQYGSFFLPPPVAGRPPPRAAAAPPPGFMPPYGPPPPAPYANYGNPYASYPPPSNGPGNGAPQRPLFQSHANEAAARMPVASNSMNMPPGYDYSGAQQWSSGPAWADPATLQWMNAGDWSAYDANAIIDQQMRKKLPAWILEGLEQAEKEKQKKAEKEAAQKKDADKEREREKRRKEKGLGKFDTDSEEEDDDKSRGRDSKASSSSSSRLEAKPAFAPSSKIGHKRKSRDIDEREYRENEMAATKRLVTDVLLRASDKALDDQVKRYLSRVRAEAKPKVIKKSSALAALSSIVGYSDDEDSD